MPPFLPQSLAKASNQVSYWGTKWLHCRILSVLVWASASAMNGAEIAGARPAAPAAAPARFRKPRRVMVELNLFPPDGIGRLLRRELKIPLSAPQFKPRRPVAPRGGDGVAQSHLRDKFLARAAQHRCPSLDRSQIMRAAPKRRNGGETQAEDGQDAHPRGGISHCCAAQERDELPPPHSITSWGRTTGARGRWPGRAFHLARYGNPCVGCQRRNNPSG